MVREEPAHPRSRGENPPPTDSKALDTGSSPLTRGKLPLTLARASFIGLIPAHAGKTRVVPNVVCETGAHPRSRGENSATRPSSRPRTGSSPLTRGKRRSRCRHVVFPGLIPAHAGKTPAWTPPTSPSTAHPRSRGENVGEGERHRHGRGSSPLTRGKLVRALVHIGYLGLIPAHAGKTPWRALGAPASRAHPRSRGENKERTVIKNRELGSSPLTRGKPGVAGCTSRADRLIPAHAGKTLQI